LSEIAQVNPADLVFLDESGIDEYLQRDYARALRGKQVISDIYGKKFGRIPVIAAWLPHAKSMIAPYVFNG